jgi:hypothetical protein
VACKETGDSASLAAFVTCAEPGVVEVSLNRCLLSTLSLAWKEKKMNLFAVIFFLRSTGACDALPIDPITTVDSSVSIFDPFQQRLYEMSV